MTRLLTESKAPAGVERFTNARVSQNLRLAAREPGRSFVTPKFPTRALIALCVALTFWASAFAGIRAGLHAYPPAHLALFRYLIAKAGAGVPEILHSGQSQFTDMVGGKPLGLTVCWINRRSIDLHPSVPPPDHIFPDIRSLLPLLGM